MSFKWWKKKIKDLVREEYITDSPKTAKLSTKSLLCTGYKIEKGALYVVKIVKIVHTWIITTVTCPVLRYKLLYSLQASWM